MTIILYTTTDAIRSAIGVEAADVADAILTGQNMELQMTVALEKFFPDHEAQFDLLQATEDRLTLWCMWYGAWRLASSPPSIPKRLSTGKDEYERFVIDWKAIAETARKQLDDLEEALVPDTTGGFSIAGKSEPGYDPITGV